MTAVTEAVGLADLRSERARYRAFVDRVVVPAADTFDQSGLIPDSVIRQIAAEGFFGAVLGSASASQAVPEPIMARLGALHEEVGRGCSSLRSLLTVHSMVTFSLARWGSDEAKRIWLDRLASGEILASFCLTEPDAGSDIAALTATATPCRGGYLLNGLKKWITAGQVADVLLVFARTERGVSAFLVDSRAPGVQRRPVRQILGTRASMLAEIRLTDCTVGRSCLIGREGMGIAVATGALDIGRYSVACGCVGIIQACLESSVAYASGRTQGGCKIAEHQLVQRMITDMATSARAARLLCAQAGRLKDEGDPNTITATCIAKYFAAGAAMSAASDTVQIHGANGCLDGHPAARFFRDAKIMEIIEGSTQIQQILIANAALQGQHDPELGA